MDQQQIAKQMIQFNKTALDISFSAMTMVYEQNEKMFETFLTQTPGLPEEGKKAVKGWMSAYRNGCNDFKKIVDENYAKVEEYFDKPNAVKPKNEVTGKKAASAASKVLRSEGSSKSAKSAAGSALSQTKAPKKVTSTKAGTAASKTLRKSGSSKAAKSSAGSALTQRPTSRKK